MKHVLFLLFLFSAMLSAAQQADFDWLIGTWQEENKMSFEVWKKDSEFLSGSAYKTDPSEKKVITEEIKLIKKGSDFFYVPDVVGPQGPVEFKITFFDKTSFTAENPAHDFPKKIIYKRMDDIHLQAWIGAGQYLSHFLFTKIE